MCKKLAASQQKTGSIPEKKTGSRALMEAALMLKSAQPPSPHPACPEPSPKPAIASLQNKTKTKNLKHAKRIQNAQHCKCAPAACPVSGSKPATSLIQPYLTQYNPI